MTPEERAKRVPLDPDCGCVGTPSICRTHALIAAAIREAVEAERQACEVLSQDERVLKGLPPYDHINPGKDEIWVHPGWRIAAAIRGRKP